jgi:hypothetical protein
VVLRGSRGEVVGTEVGAGTWSVGLFVGIEVVEVVVDGRIGPWGCTLALDRIVRVGGTALAYSDVVIRIGLVLALVGCVVGVRTFVAFVEPWRWSDYVDFEVVVLGIAVEAFLA